MAKFGIALGSGPRGRGFKSRHSDHSESLTHQGFPSFFMPGFQKFGTDFLSKNSKNLQKNFKTNCQEAFSIKEKSSLRVTLFHALSLCEPCVEYLAFSTKIEVCIDVCSGRNVCVTEPFLYVFQLEST